MHTQELRAPQFGAVQALLQEEASLPANCYHINGDGKMDIGIEIELDHPTTHQPALFVGEYFILRDNKNNNGCLYEPGTQRRGLVRRMMVECLDIGAERRPLKLLRRPTGSNIPLYLVVNPTVELPKGATSTVKFWSGIVPSGCASIARDKITQETLFAFTEDDQFVNVFYADGRVAHVIRKDGKLTSLTLTTQEQAEIRVNHALADIEWKQQNISDADTRAKRVDAGYHEIVEVLQIGGKRSEAIFEETYNVLLEAGQNGQLRPGVKARVLGVLRQLKPAAALQFSLNCEGNRRPVKLKSNITVASTTVIAPAKPKGIPPQAKAKKAARSQRDAEDRAKRRGSSADMSLKGKNGNKAKNGNKR